MITNSSGCTDQSNFQLVPRSLDNEISGRFRSLGKITFNEEETVKLNLSTKNVKLETSVTTGISLKDIPQQLKLIEYMIESVYRVLQKKRKKNFFTFKKVLRLTRTCLLQNIKQLEAKHQDLQKIEKFLKITARKMFYDQCLKLNMEPIQKELDPILCHPIHVENEAYILQDKEWPLEAFIARLLLFNPYKKIPYPSLKNILEVFVESRNLRFDIINLVSHYELYFRDKLIFKKTCDTFKIYDPVIFEELCSPLVNWPTFIDDAFIENVIKNQLVPKNSRKALEKYKGLTVGKAIEESRVFVNFKTAQRIYLEEVKDLDAIDAYLFKLCFTINKMWAEKPRGRQLLDYKELKDDTNSITKYVNNGTSFSSLSNQVNVILFKIPNEDSYQLSNALKLFNMAKIVSECANKKICFSWSLSSFKEIQAMKESSLSPYSKGNINPQAAMISSMCYNPFFVSTREDIILDGGISGNSLSISCKDFYLYGGGVKGKIKVDDVMLEKVQKRYQYFDECGYSDVYSSAITNLKVIHNCLSGEEEMSSLNLNLKTLPELLRFVKMIDLSNTLFNCSSLIKNDFKKGSYDLRRFILEKMPDLSSFEVFSKTLSKKNMSEMSHMANPKSWVTERLAIHTGLLLNAHILVNAKDAQTKLLVGARGNSGSGKSTAIGIEKGVLNPDTIKFGLRKGTEIKNHQIHYEGSQLFKRCFGEIANDAKLHYTVDLRMKTLDDVKTYLIEPAIKRECKVLLSDFDVPLLTSINRMFKRDPRGKDPLQSLGPIKEGFKEIRSHRIEIIDYIKNEKIIEQYNLYYLGRLVALKLNDKFEILDKENYNKCFEIPSDHEIEEALNRVIDEEYIKEAVMRGDLQLEDTAVLEKWKSLTIRCALEAHAGRI